MVLNISDYLKGSRAFKANCKVDWDLQFELAKKRDFCGMNKGVLMRCWNSAMKIAAWYDKAFMRDDVTCEVHWGVTGAGKSTKVFELLREKDFYVKNPLTKWWDGYKGEDIVVIDEFRGVVDISNVLKWIDKFPCNVEVKGGQVPLKATTFYIMSNIPPENWYLDVDKETKDALMRRMTSVKEYKHKYEEPLFAEDSIFGDF